MGNLLDERDRRRRRIAELFEGMTLKARRQSALAEYYCKQRKCLLLHVWQTPAGRLWYLPGYRLAPDTALSETAASARAKRTRDGLRGWMSQGGSLDGLIEELAESDEHAGFGLPVNCDHLRNLLVTVDELAVDAAAATPGKPTIVHLPRH